MKIVAMTVLCVDFYEKQHKERVGGNSLNFATQCRKEGVIDVSVIGAIGNDGYGKNIISYLNDVSIDRTHVYIKEGRTASNRILIHENGDRHFPENAWDGGVYRDFLLSEDDWQFALKHNIIAIPANDINYQETIRRRTGKNLLTVDFLGLRDYELMEKTIPDLDLVFISGDTEVMKFAKSLSQKCSAVITVTLGAEGSISYKNGEETYMKAVTVREVKDTTGCGDAYQASYSISYYRQHDIEKALEAGSISASRILEHLGAIGEA